LGRIPISETTPEETKKKRQKKRTSGPGKARSGTRGVQGSGAGKGVILVEALVNKEFLERGQGGG